ncbi:ROK family protein [Autumnicola musiva]|uniref:ROK family protein n=1 Tax=Autumnicola musiva TaxID=3075589 RepID=A0ABU3D6P3_9FLAO|nr:ROK family protein [Zunongwangia sp. F117]MDT0677200.1 ROK family protein [Zunongwangia sp. F117]
MKGKTIGIDIGATKILMGVIEDSKIINELVIPTSADSSKEKIISNLFKGIKEVSDSNFDGIGIGVPGLVDEEKGIIYDLLNIPSWEEVHLKQHLEKEFRRPVSITNDGNVFALGEKVYGKGRAYKNMVGVKLGSGFGTGIIINNKLYSGSLSSAGEIGGVPYLDKTVEDYCSGIFFLNEYGLRGNEVSMLAQKGDPTAVKIFQEYGKHLGSALKIIVNVLSPEAIFLGGSVRKSFRFFEASLNESLLSFPFKRVIEKLVIQPSDTSNIAILGAAALMTSKNPEETSYLKIN